MGSSRRQDPAFGPSGLAQFDGTVSEGTGAEQVMWVFIFYHVQRSRENPSAERVGNKAVERGAEKREGQSESSCFHSRWFPISGSNPN